MPDESEVFQKFSSIYEEESIRNAQSSNEKLDKVSGILMQIGFATASIAAVRVAGNFDEFPYTLAAVVVSALSIVCGTLQFVLDYRFFHENLKDSRGISSLAFDLWMNPQNLELKFDLRKAFQDRTKKSSSSSLVPLYFQSSLLIAAALLIFIELNKG